MLRLQIRRKLFLSAKALYASGLPAGRTGFTLIEVLVAVTILSIGLLGIASMMATSIKGGAYGRRTTVAENLALQKLEQFRNLTYTFAKALTESSLAPAGPGGKNPNQCVACPAGFTCVANATFSDPNNDCPVGRKKDPTCIQDLALNELISTEIEDYGLVIGDPEPGGSSFRRVTVIRALNGCPVPGSDNMARVTVTVSWKGRQPASQIQEHSVQLGTSISK